MQRSRVKIENALVRKGFVEQRDRDHRYFCYVDAQQTLLARTKISHGSQSREIGDDLISKMAKQCHLTKSEFLELVDCTMSQEEYGKLLATRCE